MSTAQYTVTVASCNKELTSRERIKLKDTTNAIALHKLCAEKGKITLDVDTYAELLIHNEYADNKEYPVYVVVDKDGIKYMTSSPSFWDSLCDIVGELDEGEPITIEVYSIPSKNYTGEFITCSLI